MILQATNLWNFHHELALGGFLNTIKPSSSSLLVRIRLSEFKGWKNDPADLQLINKMFMPGNIDDELLLNYENYHKLSLKENKTMEIYED
jgi:hypothetical protein